MMTILMRCADCDNEQEEELLTVELFGSTCYECGSAEVGEVR